MTARTIQVDALARVEGEGGLLLRMRGAVVEDIQLRIFEPPRFFEALLRGRDQLEAPDITARVCGICPVAYQMSACHAIEDAHGMTVDPAVRALRRLLYCGEWIESHVLHVVMLHAPDLLGLPDAVAMTREHGAIVRDGLRMKKAGNAIVRALGGREIHPINVRVGGFYRAPTRAELAPLVPELAWARGAACELLAWAARLPFPRFERDRELVALKSDREYPQCEGRLASTRGIDVDARDWEDVFDEEQVPHSNALHARVRAHGGAYVCGPLARVQLNFEQLPPVARDAARAVGFAPPCDNPFRSILARVLEVIFACDEAIRVIDGYTPPARPFADVPARAGRGAACTEAPRGLLYHGYDVDDAGLLVGARIVPPTSQNLRSIEDDLRAIAPELAALPLDEATRRAEHAVRAYDPCISCATHFVTIRREEAP